MSSCTSAPGSLTSLSLVSCCQDTGGRKKRWLEADLSRCKTGLFLSSPPPRRSETVPNGTKRRKEEASRKAHEALATCPMLRLVSTIGNTRGGRNAAPAAPQWHAETGGKGQEGLCHLVKERVLLTSCSARQSFRNKGTARLGGEGLWVTLPGAGLSPLQHAWHPLQLGEPQTTSTQR